jgi:hypothetical protein
MATKFPAPNYNRIIESDPQIVKVPFDETGWGARKSIFGEMGSDARSNNPSKPTAPEMTITHVKD